ncbi:MAG TPA: EF-P beta-lysylation protein EpmB [Gammaproteobacteria bacterium]|nr:EF-P beta-lysylation protein EpmB [Gammaproteobacteria bacterium]
MKAWQRILADSLTTSNQLLSRLGLMTDQVQSVDQSPDFPVRVPEPFVTRMVPGDPHDPLLRQVLAVADERHAMPGFVKDPLDELEGPMPGVLHKYRSRVLVIYRGGCAINCRYCFRRHFPYQENTLTARDIDGLVSYLKAHPEVNEVILSGGDPLMADDQALSGLFVRLESVSSIHRLRIHTRLPIVIPERVTDLLCQAIAATALPVVMVLHSNHANEIDQSVMDAVSQLRVVCRSVLNQSVILKGINDSADVLIALSERLFEAGIDPYYLNVLDRVSGAHHFDVSDLEVAALHQALLNALPGYLVPKLVREVPGIGHKVQWKGTTH